MPPLIALSLAVLLVLYSFREERRRNRDVSGALWIPFIWVALIGTRYASQWMNVATVVDSPDDYLEGSPLDRAIFSLLYVAALSVLAQRRIALGSFVSKNIWLVAFLAYGLISVLWSDYPWTALKRWTKVTEHIAMVLVVLSERNRTQAIDALFRRFIYFSLTLSVVFIKYFPELGRGFDVTGRPINLGVTLDKNGLGHICLLSIIFLVSSLLLPSRRGDNGMRLLDLFMISLAVWLLNLADAKTALVCSLVGSALVLILARSPVGNRPGRVIILIVISLCALAILEILFDIENIGIHALGRDPTLTDRTFVWADVLKVDNNSIVGTGFESFWLGPRAEALWRKYWWRPNQAHNGYIETFINLGAIGVILLFVLIVAGFRKILASVAEDKFLGPIRFALLVCILILNYTDATFKALHLLYFIFFLIVVEYPWTAAKVRHRRHPNAPSALRPTPASRRRFGASQARPRSRTAALLQLSVRRLAEAQRGVSQDAAWLSPLPEIGYRRSLA